MNNIYNKNKTLLIKVVFLWAISFLAVADNTTITIGGYIQLDGYNDSSTNNSAAPRGYDLIAFRSIPLDGSAAAEKDGGTKFHARSSRLSFGTSTPYEGGNITTYMEGDFFGRVDTGFGTDDDLVTNSYEFRIRQAWIKWGYWMAGQSWSNFVDLKAYPEALTFDSIVGRPFGRQAGVRYTRPVGAGDSLSFSFENPDTDYNRGTPGIGLNSEEDESIPDFIATYFNTTNFGHFRLSLLLRHLAVDTTNTAEDIDSAVSGSTRGYGVAASGRFNFGEKIYLKWNLLGGDGVGRYLSNNQYRSSILTEDGNLETESVWGGNLSLQYQPSKKFRFNVSYGQHTVDIDDELVFSTEVTKKITALNVNGIWTLAPKLTFGLGLTHGTREVDSGLEGDLTRVMFNVKRNFSLTL